MVTAHAMNSHRSCLSNRSHLRSATRMSASIISVARDTRENTMVALSIP